MCQRSGPQVMHFAFGRTGLLVREKAHTHEGDREHSPADWPQPFAMNGDQFRMDGRPAAQWSRLADGRSDGLTGAAERLPR